MSIGTNRLCSNNRFSPGAVLHVPIDNSNHTIGERIDSERQSSDHHGML